MFISQSHSNNINGRMYGSSDMSVFTQSLHHQKYTSSIYIVELLCALSDDG